MLSKGGKIDWLCMECNSPDILRVGTVIRGDEILNMYATEDNIYYCACCGNWDLWIHRKKHSLRTRVPEIRTGVGLASLDINHPDKQFEAYTRRRGPVTTMKYFGGNANDVERKQNLVVMSNM